MGCGKGYTLMATNSELGELHLFVVRVVAPGKHHQGELCLAELPKPWDSQALPCHGKEVTLLPFLTPDSRDW